MFDRVRQGNRSRAEAEYGGETGVIQSISGLVQHARYGDAGHLVSGGERRDGAGSLAETRLVVEPAFAGQHQIGVNDRCFDLQQFQDQLGARFKLGIEQGLEACAHTASGTAAGHVAHIDAELALYHIRQIRQTFLQLLDIVVRCAFLRCVDPCGPLAAEQRVLHIAGDLQVDAGQALVEVVAVNPAYVLQAGTLAAQGFVVFIQKAHAQRRGQASGAVGCRAAADTENDMPGAAIQRGADQLADTFAGSVHGVEVVGR